MPGLRSAVIPYEPSQRSITTSPIENSRGLSHAKNIVTVMEIAAINNQVQAKNGQSGPIVNIGELYSLKKNPIQFPIVP